jgi:hypothetical protein
MLVALDIVKTWVWSPAWLYCCHSTRILLRKLTGPFRPTAALGSLARGVSGHPQGPTQDPPRDPKTSGEWNTTSARRQVQSDIWAPSLQEKSLPAESILTTENKDRASLPGLLIEANIITWPLLWQLLENKAFNWRLCYIFRRLVNHHVRYPITGAIENYWSLGKKRDSAIVLASWKLKLILVDTPILQWSHTFSYSF